MKRTGSVLVAAAALSAVSVASYAVGTTSATPTVKACVAKAAGSFHGVKHLAGHARIISSGSCHAWERSVAWNPHGIQGLPGAAGKPGAPMTTPTPTGTPTPNAQETITVTGTAKGTAQKSGALPIAAGDSIALIGLSHQTGFCFDNGDQVAGTLVLNKTSGGSPVTLFTITNPTSSGSTVVVPSGSVKVTAAGKLSLVVQCPDLASYGLGVTYLRTPAS